MQVQAIWDNGVFRPTLPLALKRRQVMIHVPDEAIVRAGESRSAPTLDGLLSQRPDDPWLQTMQESEARILALPEDQLPVLTDRQVERMAAFAQREER